MRWKGNPGAGGVSARGAAGHTLDVVTAVCCPRGGAGVARLPGTTGSDPRKLSSAFHRGNGWGLLHPPERFTVKDLGENLPTISLSGGVCAAGWSGTPTYFPRTPSTPSRRAACEDWEDVTLRGATALFHQRPHRGLGAPGGAPKRKARGCALGAAPSPRLGGTPGVGALAARRSQLGT